MIPATPKVFRTKAVRERASWRNRALRDSRNTIFSGAKPLRLSMPVESYPFGSILDVVGDSNLNGVPPIGFYQRPRELVIDEDNAFLVAIKCLYGTRYRKVVHTNGPGIGNSAGCWVSVSPRVGLPDSQQFDVTKRAFLRGVSPYVLGIMATWKRQEYRILISLYNVG